MGSAMSGSQFTRKLGPLPVWAWAVVLLVGYYAYNHFKNSKSAAPAGDTTANGSYVPGFDSSTGATGSAYNTPNGSTITNNYYGDQNGAQSSGGGTSNGVIPPSFFGGGTTTTGSTPQQPVAPGFGGYGNWNSGHGL